MKTYLLPLVFTFLIAFAACQVQIRPSHRSCGAPRVRVLRNSAEFYWILDYAVREVNKNTTLFPSNFFHVPVYVTLANKEICDDEKFDIYFLLLELARTKCLPSEIEKNKCEIVKGPVEYEIICYITKDPDETDYRSHCYIAPMMKRHVNIFTKNGFS